jgi:hypothetical protein
MPEATVSSENQDEHRLLACAQARDEIHVLIEGPEPGGRKPHGAVWRPWHLEITSSRGDLVVMKAGWSWSDSSRPVITARVRPPESNVDALDLMLVWDGEVLMTTVAHRVGAETGATRLPGAVWTADAVGASDELSDFRVVVGVQTVDTLQCCSRGRLGFRRQLRRRISVGT